MAALDNLYILKFLNVLIKDYDLELILYVSIENKTRESNSIMFWIHLYRKRI